MNPIQERAAYIRSMTGDWAQEIEALMEEAYGEGYDAGYKDGLKEGTQTPESK